MVVAQAVDVTPLLGKEWYGLYLHGKKAGYSFSEVTRAEDGTVTVTEDARFRGSMAGVKQDLHMFSKRTYGPDGGLIAIASEVVDPASTSVFDARVEGDALLLRSVVSGEAKEERLARPAESLEDAVKYSRWVLGAPKLGDRMTYQVFEPMYEKELEAVSTVVGVEERVLDGVTTRVYKIATRIDLLGVDSVSFVSERGTVLEDVIAGIITMRLETEETAKDVGYENDVIVSNAALVSAPIADPRGRKGLRLFLRGPISAENVYNDERQFMEASGDGYNFVSQQVSLEGLPALRAPIVNPEVQDWTKSTTFIQSDSPKMVQKAQEILAGETDAVKVSEKLCRWVYSNMKSTFSARLTNALEVLEHLEGDCTEHSVLFIGLARAAGLPAREVAGLIYVEGPQPGFYFHQWAKVWVGKWIDVDPTFNQPLADVTHIKLSEGDLFRQARIIPLIGNIKVEVLPDLPETAADAD